MTDAEMVSRVFRALEILRNESDGYGLVEIEVRLGKPKFVKIRQTVGPEESEEDEKVKSPE